MERVLEVRRNVSLLDAERLEIPGLALILGKEKDEEPEQMAVGQQEEEPPEELIGEEGEEQGLEEEEEAEPEQRGDAVRELQL